jgi:hypothetical protein
MRALRVFGILIALGGLGLLLYTALTGSQNENNNLSAYGLFAMLGGLLLAMAADAGEKMRQPRKGKTEKREEKAAKES